MHEEPKKERRYGGQNERWPKVEPRLIDEFYDKQAAVSEETKIQVVIAVAAVVSAIYSVTQGHFSQGGEELTVREPSHPPRPPKVIEGFFWLLLPRRVRDAVLGDAAEAYTETIQKFGGSRVLATLDYCKEAVFAIMAAARMSVADCIRFLMKRSS